jgi:large repetitive protein
LASQNGAPASDIEGSGSASETEAMANPQAFTIGTGQDVVIDGFALGSTTLRFEGTGFSASNLLIDQQGQDTVLTFVGSNTRVRLTNFEASNFGTQSNFAQSFQFSPVVSPTNNESGPGIFGGGSNNASPNAGSNGSNAQGNANGPDNGNAGANSNGNGNGGAQVNLNANGNDSLTGSGGDETLRGGAGNDTVRGMGGNDRLEGGTGSDWLQGGDGNDTLVGSVDATWTSGWGAFNAGSPGAPGTGETISIANMTRSQDVFDGGAGVDILRLGSGNDAIFLDDPYSPTPNSGARIRAVEIIEAGDGNDIVDLTSANFALGNVTIDGGAGNDTLWSSAGDDSLAGGAGNDSLFGGAGRDTLVGGEGNDTLDGGRGNDLLIGGAGNDVIRGGAGNETATITVSAAYGGGGQSSWNGLNLSAQNVGANGALGSSSSANVGFTGDGFGAAGNQASRPSVKAETGYDPVARVSETVSVGFASDVGTATVSLAWFYGPQTSVDYNLAEQAFWRILNDGAVVAQGTVTANGTSGNQSFTIDPPGDAAFDTIVMWAGPYVSATGAPAQGAIVNDSSDFLIRAISTTATVADEAARGGNDRIIGGSGNDNIDGGAGVDTSVYSSFISDYVFSRTADGALVVTGAGAGAIDGADTLVNVEFLEFLNGVVVPTANLGLNSAPDARNSAASGNEDNVIAGQLTATDANGDPLTYALAANGGPANGTLTINPNGTYSYTPNANFNGTDTFTYTVSDGRGGTDTATVTLNVASVNDAPTTSGGTASGAEDGTVTGTLTASDVDGNALSFALAPNGAPANGTVTINPNGTYSYTPAANFNGTDSFTYRVSDGQGGTTLGTISVTVSPTNDAPTTSGATVSGQEDGSIAGQVTGADVDGNPLTFALNGAPANGAVTMNPDGTFSYVPAANFNGTDTFTYTVSDGQGGTTTGTVSVNVAAVNDAPTTSGGAATGAEDGTVTGTLTGSDVDGDTLSFGLAPNGAPANGTVTINPNGTYSYTPAANFNGTDSFTYRVSDGQGGTTLGTISVTVTPGNDAPTTSGATVAGQEDGSIAGQVTGADVDGNTLTFALDGAPANGTVTMNPNGTFSYVPAANFNGTDTFTYTVSDGQGGTTTGTVSVNVAAVNDAPTTSGGAATGAEDGTVTGTLTGSDVDGDTLSFALAPNGGPAHGSVTINPNGTYSYTPAANFNGTDSFTYAISDGQGGTTLGTISVTVSPTNDAPTTSGATVAGQEDGSIAGQVTGADVDGNTLSYALDGAPANGTVTMNPNGTFSYVPAANFNGTDTFTYTVSDGQGGTTTGTVSVNVAAVNDAPTTSGGAATGAEDGTVTGTLTGSDVDGDTLSFGLAPNGAPANGTVTINPNGTYSYTPAANFNGTDSFTYAISDGQGGTTLGTISVTVSPTNDAPTTSGATVAGQEDGSIAGQVTGSDIDGNTLSYALDGAPANGTVTMNPNGTFSYVPAANFNGTDTFTYTVSDGQGGTTTGTVSVNVAAVNDAPTTSGGAATGAEDGTVTGTLTGSDVDGDTLSFGLAPNGAPANGTVTINPNGTYSYTPAANFNGTDSFTYAISDGQGGTTLGTISVTVSPTNDAPTTSGATVAGQEDGSIAGQVTGADVDGNPLTFALNGAPANGTVTMNPNGTFSYVPAANFNGTDTFTYTVSDGQGGTTTGTVSVNVAAVNDAPTTAGGTSAGNEDTTITGTLTASDVDGDALSFALAQNGGPAHGTVTVNPNGTYSYTPAADYSGSDSFTYSVTDANGATTVSTVTLNVAPVADTPNVDVAFGSPSVNAGTSSVTVTDFAGEAGYHNSYGYYTLNASGEPVAGRIVWADVKDHVGQSVTIPGLDAARTGFFIIPNGDNNNPGRIQDGESVGFVKGSDGKWIAVDAQGNAFAGSGGANAIFDVPALNVGGRVMVTDNSTSGNQNWEDIAVGGDRDFNDVNTNAAWASDNNGTSAYPLNVSASPSDRDGSESLTGVTLTGIPAGAVLKDPSGATIAPNADGSYSLSPSQLGSLTLITPPGFSGALNVTATATAQDGASFASASDSASTQVGTGNLAPVTAGGVVAGTEDTATTGQLQAQDPNGDPLTFALAPNGGPAHGTLTINPNGTYSYTPAANFNGADSFTYTVSDGNGGTATGTIVVNVASVNDAPTTSGGTASGNEDTIVTGALAASDIDGGTLSFALAPNGGPAHGSVTINPNGTYSYTPAANFNGTDSFTYRVSDGQGGTTLGTISVTVSPTNDAPTTSGATVAGQEDGSIAGQVTGADVDGNPLTFALNGAPANGTVTMNPNGTFSYVPAANFNGTDTFTYTVSDGQGGTTTGTVSVNVAAVNDAPTTSGGAASGNEDTTITGQLAASDVDGDTLSFALAPNGGPGHGTVTVNPDGSYSYVPAQGFAGTDSFTYTVSDGKGGTTAATVAVNVAAVDSVLNYTVDGTWPGGWAAMNVGSPGAPGTGEIVSITGMGRTFGVYDGGAGQNTLVMANGNNALFLDDRYSPPTLNEPRLANIDTIQLGTGNQLIDLTSQQFALGDITIQGNSGNDTIWSSAGDDLITAGAGADKVYAGAGDDTAAGGTGNDAMDGASGVDTAVFSGRISDYIFRQDTLGTIVVTDTRPGAPDGRDTIVNFEFAKFLDGTISTDGLGINRPPVAPNVGASGAEDTATAGQLVAQDVDGDPLTFALAQNGGPANGTVTINPDGSYTYTPAANFNGTDTFRYTVSDGRGGVSTGTVTMTVASVNDAPTTQNASASGNEDTVITGALSASDVDGDQLGFALAPNGGPAHGTVTIDPNGTYSYVPNANFNGTDAFTYTVSDGKGGTATATVSLNVAAVNDAPTTSGGSAAGNEDAAIYGTVTGADIDGDALNFALGQGPAHGTVTLNADGTYIYTPAANYFGADTFTYTVSDGKGGTATGTVSVAVASVNDAPDAAPQSTTGNEDAVKISGRALATDVEGDALTFALAPNGGPANGSLTFRPDGSFDYVPAANFNGSDAFTYTVSDGNGGVTTATMTLYVTAVNDAPTAPAQTSLVGTEDVAMTGTLPYSDVDGDRLTFAFLDSGIVPPELVTVNPDGTFVARFPQNYSGAFSFDYTATDPSGASTQGRIFISVLPANDAPWVQNGSIRFNEEGQPSGQLSFGDVDAGDSVTIALAPGGGPAHGIVTISPTGWYNYTPNPNFNGTDSFQFAVTDSSGATTIGTFTLNVTPVNDAPVTTPTTVVGNEDTAISGQLAATDADGDAITYYLPYGFGSANGQLTFNPDGSFTFVPTANWSGQVEAVYHARDAQGAETEGRLYINVAAVNDGPIALNANASTNEDTVLAGRLTATDVDGDALTFGLAPGGGPQHGTLTILPDGSYTYIPSANYNGADTFTYTVNDGKGGTTTATLSVNVTPVNDAPVAQFQTANATEDTALTGQLAATDVDGDALTYSLAANGQPLHGTVTLNMDGSFTYVPAANYNGTDSFVYQVSDGKGGVSSAAVTLNVAAVNDAPTAGTGALATNEDTVLAGRLSASDPDGNPLTFALVGGQGPSYGSLSLQPNGNYVYTPAPNFNGTDSFAYTVSDGQGGTATRTVTVSVAPVNDAPTTANSSVAGQEDTAIAGRVVATDIDSDALNFTVPVSGRPANGTVTMNGDGSYSYVPNANFNGTDTFTYAVSDGKGGTATGTVTVNVAAVNDAPTVTSGPIPGIEDTVVSGRIAAVDPEGRTPTFALVSGPANGSLTFASDGSYTYAPSANYNGIDSFVVTVSDGNGGVTTFTQQIQIAAVNDAPTTSGSAVTGTSNEPIVGALTAADVDGDALAFAIAANGGPAHGTLALQPNGAYVYTPAPGFNGADSFVYTVSDGKGGFANATISISVAGANDAPVAGNTAFTLAEDTALSGNLGVVDPEGDAYSVALAQGPTHGAIQFGPDGTFTYTPGANYNGADSFAITLTDAAGATRTQTISLDVTPVVDVPYLAPLHLTIQEDSGALVIPLNVLNPDGYAIGLGAGVWQSPLGSYSWTPDGQAVVFTPNAEANGTANLSVLYWDSLGNGAFVPLTIDILPVDDGPRATTVTQFFGVEDSVSTGQLQAYDPDGGTIASYQLAAGPEFGQVTVNPDGTFAFTPPPNWYGTQTFTYIATDSTGTSSTLTATLTIQNVPDAPIIRSATYTGNEDTILTGSVEVIDPDDLTAGGPGTWWFLFAPGSEVYVNSGHVLTLNPDSDFVYRPDTNWFGTASVQVIALNASGMVSDPATLTFVTTPVNDAPTTQYLNGDYGFIGTAEDTAVTGNLAYDVNSGQIAVHDIESPLSELTFAVHRQAQHGTVTIDANGDYVYTPANNYSGWDNFAYTITDPDGATIVVEASSIYVWAVPDPIVWQTTFSAQGNHQLFGDVAESGGSLAVMQESAPEHGTLTLNADGSFVYTPNDGFSGIDSFTVSGFGETSSWETRQIFVTVDPNDAPVVQSGDTEGRTGGLIEGQLAATDAEGDALLYTLITPPGDGSLTLNPDGSFVYQPGASLGPQTFEYQVADGFGGTTTATHTIDVFGVAEHQTSDAIGNWTLSDHVHDTVHLTSAGPEGPDTVVGFQAAEDKIDVSALFGADNALPADWAAQLTAHYDAGAGGTFIGVAADGGGTPEWGVLLQGVNTTLDDLLNQGALQASQNPNNT